MGEHKKMAAIIKALFNLAVQGDMKAAAIILRRLETRKD